MSIKEYLAIFKNLLGAYTKKIPLLIFLFFFVSMLDLIGLALLGPYISFITDPNSESSGFFFVNFLIENFGGNLDPYVILGLSLIIVFLIKCIVAILVHKKILWFCRDIQFWLRTSLMRSYQNIQYSEYIGSDSSDYINNTSILTMYFANNVLFMSMKAFGELIVAIAIFALLIILNGPIVLYLLLVLVVSVGLYQIIFRKRLNFIGENINKAQSSMVQAIKEGLEGLKEIRVLGRESYFFDRARKNAKTYSHLHAQSSLISGSSRYALEFTIISFFVATLTLATIFNPNSQAEIFSSMTVFAFAAIRLMPSANVISNAVLQLSNHKNTLQRLSACMTQLNEENPDKSSKGNDIDAFHFQTLTAKNLVYRYPDSNKEVINNISLEIKEGETIGFMGVSGSGKTTLIDLFLGLLEPTNGSLKINNIEINKILGKWHSKVAYIPQEILLVNDTLQNNILLDSQEFLDSSVSKKLNDSLKHAQLKEVLKELPEGINTFLGERGIKLSGGQKQRVALARSLFHDREVLIFDEATSALDEETEKEITREINSMKGEKTIIIIAHRMETLKYCNRIYRIDNGSITEFGSPDIVLRK